MQIIMAEHYSCNTIMGEATRGCRLEDSPPFET